MWVCKCPIPLPKLTLYWPTISKKVLNYKIDPLVLKQSEDTQNACFSAGHILKLDIKKRFERLIRGDL